MPKMGMFKDLKVLELASVLAGPMVGTFFSELGANVIKIENKRTDGDVTRNWKLPLERSNEKISAYYASANWNKEVLFLDLSLPTDYELFIRLVREADIIVSNFKSKSAVKLRVDYETLKKSRNDIIYGEITGFGSEDERTGYDVVLQAESGFMYMTGTKESGPVKMPVAMIDLLAAHQLKEGLLIALMHRMSSGKGSKVSVSLFDAAISSLANQASNWLNAGHIPERIGSLHPNIAPYGKVFQTKDQKQFVLAIGSDRQFEALCKLIELEYLHDEERFCTNQNRVINREALNDLLQPVFIRKTLETWMERFKANQIPAGAIRNMKALFELKAAQQMILRESFEGSETSRVKTIAFETDFALPSNQVR